MAVLSAVMTAGVTTATHAMQTKYSVSSNEVESHTFSCPLSITCLQFLSNIMPKQTCIMLLSGPLIDYAVSRGGVVYRDFEWTESAIFAIRYYFDLCKGAS